MRRRYGPRLGGATTVFQGPYWPRVHKNLYRVITGTTAAVQHKLEVIKWLGEHQGYVRRTARHFGHSPDTVSRWAEAYYARGVEGLFDRSRRPKKVRTPTTPLATAMRIRELRERYPRWGREKLRILLERDGITVSAKTIDRTLARLRARGDLREPRVVRKVHEMRLRAFARTRRPGDLLVDRPGFLQIDTQELRRGGPFTFAAIDHLTRKRVLGAARRNTAAEGARFLERACQTFPFAIWAIQTDGGSEYMGEFAQTAAALGITQYVNRPNYPKGQGRVERSFLTDDVEFHQVDDLPMAIGELVPRLAAWNHIYEEVRPHQALGYLTPNAFYARWLTEHGQATIGAIS
ncbi:MAG TPA: helix-turn-helix domain-containing protein [Candidatus Limnocylindria bacterium]|nr:helix-turn-helix domain-containing protein [Candidatus Limnocylindria bacterium]